MIKYILSKQIILSFALLVMFASQVPAHETEKKELISPSELTSLIGSVQILDIRIESEYAKGHIPTALSVSFLKISFDTMNQIGFTPDKTIILYANSENKPRKAKLLLNAMEFKDIRILAGGINHWIEDGYKIVSGSLEIPKTNQIEKSDEISLSIEPDSYDFGLISKADGDTSTVFKITNLGEEIIKIDEISTSCGCTTALMDDMNLKPGETKELYVIFNPNFHSEPQGRFSRSIFLNTSSGYELDIKIHVELKE